MRTGHVGVWVMQSVVEEERPMGLLSGLVKLSIAKRIWNAVRGRRAR